MIWQDVVVGAGQFIFALSLIPAIRSSRKPPFSTCLITGMMLLAYVIAFITLHLWWSALSCAICAIMWIILALQQVNDGG